MHVAEVRFQAVGQNDDHLSLIQTLLGSWRSNWQILGNEFPIAFTNDAYRSVLMLPAPDALAAHHDGKYVTYAKSQLADSGFEAPTVSILGEDPSSAESCSCPKPNFFILYTTFISIESCLRCGECFNPLPHYRVPNRPTSNGELYDNIMSWQSDYQACDTLQMNCATGEKFGLREMSRHDSSLSRRGREICDNITEATDVPTYYYLHRYRGRSQASEKIRPCPSCGGQWLMKETMHNIFDFKCDRCRLLSNIAMSFPIKS